MFNINPQDFLTLVMLFSLATIVLGIIAIFWIAGRRK